MKGVADRTPELLNEFQKVQFTKSYNDFQHFLVVKIEQLEDKNEALREELADSDMELLDSVIQDVVFGDIFRLVWKHANLEKRWLKQQVEIMGYDTDIDALLKEID